MNQELYIPIPINLDKMLNLHDLFFTGKDKAITNMTEFNLEQTFLYLNSNIDALISHPKPIPTKLTFVYSRPSHSSIPTQQKKKSPSICEHGRRRSTCKACGGASICEHGIQRSHCKECGDASIC